MKRPNAEGKRGEFHVPDDQMDIKDSKICSDSEPN